MKAYKHQKEILKDPRKKLILAWDTGTGKTYGAELLNDHHGVKSLVIVPKSNKEKWLFMEEKGHYVVTKEYFRDHLDEIIEIAKAKSLNGVTIDEAHFFAGNKSKMTKALVRYNKAIGYEYIWLLTATPHLSTPWNTYTLLWHCGKEMSFPKFRDMFFYKVKMGFNYIWKPRETVKLKDGKSHKAIDVLHKLLENYIVWVDFEDVARDNDLEYDVLEQTKKEVFFHQPLQQVRAQALLTEEGIALWTKKHTVQNGFYEDDYLGVKYYEDPKLIHILSTAKKNRKMAVVCRYHRQMERYQEALEKDGHTVFLIKGGVKNIEGLCARIDAMGEVIVIIQANVSEGYELPNFPYAIFASLSFAYKDYKQMFGRFLRVNAITPTHVDILLMVDGVDIDVYKSVSNKENFYLSNYKK